GTPVQRIQDPSPVPLPLIEIEADSPDGREREARLLIDGETERPFNLESGPLLRPLLLRLGAEEHILLLTMHHIVSDGWSRGVLTRELGTLYAAFAAGERSPLPELAIQYADYAAWQRETLDGEALERQLTFWKEHLAGAPALLDLPTDH